MKALIPLLTALTVGCAAHAQPRAVLVAPSPDEDDVIVIAQAPPAAPKPAPAAKALPGAPPRAPEPPEGPNININKAAHGTSVTWSGPSVKGFGFSGSSSSSSRRTLIVPKGEPNPE